MTSSAKGRGAGGPVALLATLVRGTFVHLARWAPVWVPLVLLWQVAERGYAPARAESQRLDAERAVVEARHARTRATFEEMRSEVDAWSDPVYRARVRELLDASRRPAPAPSQGAQASAPPDAPQDPAPLPREE